MDGYGVGTQLVVGSGHPTVGLVYKLVAREGADGELVGVAKRSSAKESWPGRHWARRRHDVGGTATEEVVGTGDAPALADGERDLLVPLVRDGEVVGREPLTAARERHARSRDALPLASRALLRGEPVLPTVRP